VQGKGVQWAQQHECSRLSLLAGQAATSFDAASCCLTATTHDPRPSPLSWHGRAHRSSLARPCLRVCAGAASAVYVCMYVCVCVYVCVRVFVACVCVYVCVCVCVCMGYPQKTPPSAHSPCAHACKHGYHTHSSPRTHALHGQA